MGQAVLYYKPLNGWWPFSSPRKERSVLVWWARSNGLVHGPGTVVSTNYCLEVMYWLSIRAVGIGYAGPCRKSLTFVAKVSHYSDFCDKAR